MSGKFILVALLSVTASSSAFAASAPNSNTTLTNSAASKRVVNQPSALVSTQAITTDPRHANRQDAIDRVLQILEASRRTPPASP